MRTETDPLGLQREALRRRARGETIGFVPTMGYLHEGHTSLMTIARERCDWLVASIYVNPLQFGAGEDLDRYPRDLKGDAHKCEKAGVDLIFVPDTLYADDHSTTIAVDKLTTGLCGASRPGHFNGVTTVVARLFGLIQPHVAVFGEKDYQQLAVIRRMVRDLAMPIEVVGGPLVRDDDGMALSSRNAYLSPEARLRGRSLSQAMFTMQRLAQEGETSAKLILDAGQQVLQVDRLDYLQVVDAHTLAPIAVLDRPARAVVAAWMGATRLIDNVDLA